MKAQTVVDIIVGSPDHNTLETAVIAAQLDDDLSGPGPFTVFAPTDAAFDALPAGALNSLLADPTGALANVLLYHVVGAQALSTDLSDGQVIATLSGGDVTVTINGSGVFINDAQVTVADIVTTNGVVHVIDAVLLEPAPTPTTVFDIIANSADHNTLETALVATGLSGAISGDGPYTVFAPTDAAFAALPAGALDALLVPPYIDLTNILLYHVVAGQALSTDLADGQTISTLVGADLTVTINANGVFINNAQVTVADLIADNGVVHVVDAVLFQPQPIEGCTAMEACNYNPEATIEDGSCELPGAPCDDANELTLNDVLGTDCVCAGDLLGCTNAGACNFNADAGADDGSCYFPGDSCDDNNAASNNDVYGSDCVCAGIVPTNTIVDIVVNSEVHNTLETAVIAAGLADDLSGEGPFTVFAPTDAAFDALPAGTLDALLADPTGDLAQILLYHAVSGVALSTDLSDGQMIATLQGQDVTVTINANGVFINDAQVIVADIIADNGVVHVIDAVLLPQAQPTNTILDIVVNSESHTTLEAAVLEAGLEGALAGPGPLTVFAPTDAAFAALPAGTLDALLADPTGALTQVLLYHVVGASALSTDLSDGQMIATIQGQDVTVTITGGNVFINDAQVIVADIIADNGVVHVIDAVLVPSFAVEGCTALEACNYNAEATVDNGSCELPGFPCDDANAMTVNDVLGLDCVCAGDLMGCTNTSACNFDANAGVDDGSCYFSGDNCDDGDAATEGDVYGADCVCAGTVPTNTVVDIVVNSPDHNTLEAAVIAAGLAGALSGDGPFTVFAPTDAAFAALPAGLLDVLLADPTGDLANILLYHVVGAQALSTDLSDGQIITTLQGQPVTVAINMGSVMINNANVTVADILADNGVVHVIDAVLVPQVEGCTAIEACNYNPDAVVEDGSCALPGSPCDDNNDMTANDTYAADCSCVGDLMGCTNDIACNYNVAAIIDDASCYFTGDSCDDNDATTTGDVYGADCTCAGVVSTGTVVDIIANSPDHITLEAAVVAAGLVDALSGVGPFTVFAPTDAAFAALPAGTLDALLADPTGELTQILLYHVVEALALSTDLSNGQIITTMQGQEVVITILGDQVYVNDILVTVADVIASNGVVHVINAVLLPPVPAIPGCTATEACNYDPLATSDDGSCLLIGSPCDDGNAATTDDVLGADCVCMGLMAGCTVMDACNYDMNALVDDGSCYFSGDNCDDNNPATINDVYTADCGCAGIISNNTVVDIIVNSPDHNTLETAVIAAGLAGTLSSTGPFTVFAPTDAAFEALPAGLLDVLLADPTGDLTQILLYHVVGAEAFSTDLSDGQQIITLQGSSITVTISGGAVIIDGVALVIAADLNADNGVVHVINAVLLPPAAPVEGCTAIEACNYNPEAVIDNGTCELPGFPCDDNNNMTIGDILGTDCLCTGTLMGCTEPTACNYNEAAVLDDGSCALPGDVCDDGIEATVNDVYGADCICAGTIVSNTVVDIIVNSPDHNVLETAVIAAGLADDLSTAGPFTVFAPTDAAFAALPAGALDALLADPTGALADVLLYHVVGGLALSTDLSNGQVITTLLGEDITVTIDMNGVMINDAMVTVADITADNGVVHVIDAVLLPPAQPSNTILDIVVNSEVHTILEAAVIAAELQGALAGPGPLTVFAPTDGAFEALPAGTLDALLADPTGALTQVLLYHAVAGAALSTDLSDGQMIATLQGQDVTVTITGGNVFINDAQVIIADIIADNGVVHVIDAVLVPQSNPQPETVVEIIVNSPDHTVLETAVIAAGLADDLSGTGPFTVFAPTDNAFAALPAGVLDALLADPTGALAQVLLYHVVAGEALSSSLTNGQTITTLQGQDVTVSITGGNVFINDAQVIMADIMADNGVVHVIDAVLTPETRVSEVNLNSALVYPNPASEQLTVSVPALLGNATYSIYSSTGSLVTTGLFTTATTTLNVDMLSQGMYQVKINNGSECVTRTFMKK